MYYIGLDHHRKFTQVAVVDESDGVIFEARMNNTEEAIRNLLERWAGPKRAVVEAGPSWGWIYDTFQKNGVEIVLANPAQVRVIAETRCKTDRRDARALARLLRAGWIPQVYVSDPETRLNKQLWRERIWLVRMQTRLKNRIRHLLAHHHVPVPDYSDLFGKAGRKFLESLQLPCKAQKILSVELVLLSTYQEHIFLIQKDAKEATASLPAVGYLQSLPGLGEVLAPIAALEMGDIGRFKNAGSLSAYCGLVPSVYSSGGWTHRGPVGRTGNHWLKWVFVEAAWTALNKMPELRQRYERLKIKKGPQVAIVACARHLCEIAYSLLKNRRNYQQRTLVYA